MRGSRQFDVGNVLDASSYAWNVMMLDAASFERITSWQTRAVALRWE